MENDGILKYIPKGIIDLGKDNGVFYNANIGASEAAKKIKKEIKQGIKIMNKQEKTNNVIEWLILENHKIPSYTHRKILALKDAIDKSNSAGVVVGKGEEALFNKYAKDRMIDYGELICG